MKCTSCRTEFVCKQRAQFASKQFRSGGNGCERFKHKIRFRTVGSGETHGGDRGEL